MDSSVNASPAGPLDNDTSTPKPNVKRSPWFTPCKQLGLKRKSSSISSHGNASSSGNTPNSSFKSHRTQFVTPTRKNDSFEAKTVQGSRPNSSVQNPMSVIQDDTSSRPSSSECLIEQSNAPVKIPIPLPCIKVTPIRCRPRPMLSRTPIIHGGQTPVTPKATQTEDETETLEIGLDELTEEHIEILRKRVKEKEERVSALKLTMLYKKKHNTEKLTRLTNKWRSGCQEALRQLLEKTKALGYQHTMPELLAQLRIPNDLVQYDPDLEDFKE